MLPSSIRHHPKMREDARIYDKIAEYINNLTIGEPTEESTGGVTWLELYGSAEIHGVQMDRHDKVFQAGRRCFKKPTMEQNYMRFIKATKKIVGYGLSDTQHEFFKASKAKSERLKSLGIQYHQRSIKGIPEWDTEHAKKIADHITMMQVQVNDNIRKQIAKQK